MLHSGIDAEIKKNRFLRFVSGVVDKIDWVICCKNVLKNDMNGSELQEADVINNICEPIAVVQELEQNCQSVKEIELWNSEDVQTDLLKYFDDFYAYPI